MDVPTSADDRVDVGRLVEALRDKTQCYKILFLRALIDDLVEVEGTVVPYRRLAARMVELTWWPVRCYRLSIGSNDLLAKRTREVEVPEGRSTAAMARSSIYGQLGDQTVSGFLEYVPQRLLRPWFRDLVRGTGHGLDAAIRQLGRLHRDRLGLPYCHDAEAKGVDVAPEWRSYFVANVVVLRGWLDLEWLDWLQLRNPNAPVSRRKLAPPPSRRALHRQSELFKSILQSTTRDDLVTRCVYDEAKLDPSAMSVDHFLPWSFVAHDAIWNLVPVSASLNSSKQDRLPEQSYVPRLAEFHSRVIAFLTQDGSGSSPYLDEYALGLRLERSKLGDPRALLAAFGDVMEPLLRTARSMGFQPDWSLPRATSAPPRTRSPMLPDDGAVT